MVSTRQGGDYSPEKTNPSCGGGRKRGGGVSSGASAAAAAKRPSRGPRPGEEEEEDAVADEEEEEAEAEAEAEMGEAEVEEAEMGEAWQRVTKKSKFEMSFNKLHSYYESKLRQVGKCPNRGWNCLEILSDGGVHASVVMYVLVQQKDKVQTRCARF